MTDEDTEEYVCINCGSPVKNLFKKYSTTVLKLTECDYCNSIADKYVEYDTVIIIIDLILLRVMAYRHILLNSKFKNFWKLSLILLLLETYSNWTMLLGDVYNKSEINDTKPYLTEPDLYLEDLKFYVLCLNIAISAVCFVSMVYLLTVIYFFLKGKAAISFLMICKTVTLSSSGIFLFLPSLIWDISIHEYHLLFISIYTTLSQLLAYKALCNCEKIWSLLVIFSSLLLKTYIRDSFSIITVYNKIFLNYIICFTVILLSKMSTERKASIKNGYWMWDELTNGLFYVSRDAKDPSQRCSAIPATSSIQSQAPRPVPTKEVNTFTETVGNLSQLKFRKYFQRKVKLTEPEVVTIQDVKDVAIFTCQVSMLTPEFISYFHSQSMDNFIRSLIIYFQYYFQIWNKMQLRRKEASRKLRQPIVTQLENIVRDDLADLRGMVARDYAVILLGMGDAKTYHHMNNKNNESFSDRDRRLFECLVLMITRVIWIALSRKYLTLIEKELNRILRTNIFSSIEHKFIKSTAFDTFPEEDRVLIGKAYTSERKLLHRSPAIQELIFDNHDYRMLAIGIADTDSCTERDIYLEAAYSAPEELLQKLGVPVGILGIPRKYFDAMLKPKEVTTKRISTLKSIPDFVIPPKIQKITISQTLPKKKSKYQETEMTKITRHRQCKMWREYVELEGVLTVGNIDMASVTPSFTTLRASIAPVYSKYN